jgi:hypothetical protein
MMIPPNDGKRDGRQIGGLVKGGALGYKEYKLGLGKVGGRDG